MNTFIRFTSMDLKLFFRDAQATFFTFFFNILMLLIFGAMFGNEKSAEFGGFGFIDMFLPGLISISILALSMFTLGAQTVVQREQGILRRYLATPLHPITVIGSTIVLGVVLLILSTILTITVGIFVFDVSLPSQIGGVIGAIAISMISFFAFGLALFSFIQSSKAAFAISSVVLNIMMFLSGAFIPLTQMPDFLKTISNFIPLKYVVDFIQGIWQGESFGDNLLNIAVLIGIFIISSIVAVRYFKWE